MATATQDRPKIFTRWDQCLDSETIDPNQDPTVTIFAPRWVSEGLARLSQHILAGSEFAVYDAEDIPKTTYRIDGSLSLKDLVAISRNESNNTTGLISFPQYQPLISEKSVVLALKDLVRQLTIVGRDETTFFGGYRSVRVEQRRPVMLVDLIGLQFQQDYNTGRLVLVGNNLPKGLLDELIFSKVVGEPKKSFDEVESLYNSDPEAKKRYVRAGDVYFDSLAYKKFVADDVVLTGLAINSMANKSDVHFKFLKYGTGYFAGSFSTLLNKHIYLGVAEGLERLFQHPMMALNRIKSIELPFFETDKTIEDVCRRFGVGCRFSHDDALKQTVEGLLLATTDCGDPHAVMGNEMRFGSVDGAIGENIASRGNKFSPVINRAMAEEFVDVDLDDAAWVNESDSSSRL